MNKIWILGLVLILMSSFAIADGVCDYIDCDRTKYNFFDRSNLAGDGATVGDGDSVFDHGYSPQYDQDCLYESDIYNTAPVSILNKYHAYNAHEPINEGSYNAMCVEVYYPVLMTPSSASCNYINTDTPEHVMFVQAGNKCDTDDLGALCYSCGSYNDFTTNVAANTWYSFCVNWNGTATILEIFNGSDSYNLVESIPAVGCGAYPFNGIDYKTNNAGSPGSPEKFYTDNIRMGNWSVGEMGILSSSSSTIIPQFINPTPTDNYHNNIQPIINCSHNGTNITFNLWIDDVLTYDNITGNYTTGIEYYANFSNGVHTYICGVQNTTDGIFSNNITRTFTFDSVEPYIIRLTNNNWAINNQSYIMSYTSNLTINYSFKDDNLYNTLINITNSSGQSKYQILNTSITGTTANYSREVNISGWALGNYTIQLSASDSHTSNEIEPYNIKKSYDKKQLEFDTADGTNILIEATDDSSDILTFDTTKMKDRYTFNIKYNTIKNKRSFIVTSDKPLIYLPDSNYPAHFISGSNWIDFYDYTINKNNVKVTILNDYTARVDIKNLNKKKLKFNSIGGLNINKVHYNIQIAAMVQVNVFNLLTNASINYTTSFDGDTETVVAPNKIYYYNITAGNYPLNITASNYYGLNYLVTINTNYHNLTYYMSDFNVLDNCSIYSYYLLNITGYDEETLNKIITPIDITIFHKSSLSGSDTKNLSLSLRGRTNYSICTNTNNSLLISSIMQFADGTTYAKRNYYINNLSINASSPQQLDLYSINYTKASEIVMTVFDTATSDPVAAAYIKTLRYYPAENILRVVEVSKTDEQGKSLAKLVLADVFYKFQIEYPAGLIKLYTETQNIYALTKSFGLSFATDYLDTWDKINDVSTAVVCVQSTKTCTYTWSDSNNIVRDATLEIYGSSGFKKELLYTNTVAASAGTIAYTIVEDTTGKSYIAKGFIESNTGTSNYLTEFAELLFSDNVLFNTSEQRISNLFPLFLLILVIVCALIDFGTIGVVIGSMAGLIIGSISGLLPLSMYYVISFVIMGGILIYKLTK